MHLFPLISILATTLATVLVAAEGGLPSNLGTLPVRVHDPSTIVNDGGRAWVFATGRGLQSYHSRDLQHWERGPRVFDKPLPWFTDVAPEQRGHLWAPDVIRTGHGFFLYYSVSQFGRQTSAIALARNAALDPGSPDYRWRDEGIVIQSHPGARFNAIDPAILQDGGRLWMTFGSFWEGIFLMELDPRTGKRKDPDAAPARLASAPKIEAPFLHKRGGFYYLFVNWGTCCQGVRSTYEIRVGRSQQITGPYRDRDGTDLRDGGGTLVLATRDGFIGPGHASIVRDLVGRERMACHFYDATRQGVSHLALAPLLWSKDGWPVIPSADPGRGEPSDK